MKKYLLFPLILLTLSLLSNCINPEGRSWIIPLTIDDTLLTYTPEMKESFRLRREMVLDKMEGDYLILKSSDQGSYNRHQFRVNNYFYYLSGFEAHGSYLILAKNEDPKYLLTRPYTNLRMQIYDGAVANTEDILTLYSADTSLSYFEARAYLEKIVNSGSTIYADTRNRDLMDDLKKLKAKNTGLDFQPVAPILDEMRVIKEPMEIARMQKACDITARALTRVMDQCQAGMYEYQMEAVIEGCFLEHGSAMPGFSSIVGSGPNSTTLHYEPNNRLMEDGDLLLMDIGADYGYYTADISRTIPVNGKFTPEQRNIYQLVLDAQKASIENMIPGKGVREGHLAGRAVMKNGLAKLGLISDTLTDWQIEFYCIHGTSHYLGMDVHDVGSYEREIEGKSTSVRMLEAGMVLTIEPGIYIRENGLELVYDMFASKADSSEIADFIKQVKPVYEQYLNIGVRIEDDILITKDGNLVLSRYAPKEPDDIEQLMR